MLSGKADSVVKGSLFARRKLITFTAFVELLALPGIASAQVDAAASAATDDALSVDDDSALSAEHGAPGKVRRSVREHSFAARPVMLELRAGISTIVGLLGATASFDPWSRLALGAGIGANTSGVQLAGFARVRPLVFKAKRRLRLHAVGIELAYSTGPFQDALPPSGLGEHTPSAAYDRVHWLQPQITYETRSYHGFNLLAGLGVEIPLASRGYHCLDPSSCDSHHHISTMPTITVGFGWALGG